MLKGWLRSAPLLIACLLVATPMTACSKAAKKARFIERGDKYFSEGKFKEAVIEYRNVLQIEPASKEVNRKLGIAGYEAGQMAAAFTFLQRAYDQDPTDVEVRLKLGTLQLLSRQSDKAREHAHFVLTKQPDNFLAVGLLADTAQTPAEIDEAVGILEDRPERFEKPEAVERALGMLYARKGDTPRAEKALLASIAAKPESPEAHSTLARLHISKGDTAEAEKEFRVAASLAAPGSRFQLELVDFLATLGRVADAKTLLEEITQKAPDAYPAWIRLADLAFQQKKLDECLKATDVVLKAQPDNTAALIIKARIELAQLETKQALETATRVVKLDGKLPMAHYVLAMAQLQSGNASLARTAANDAVARAPQFADAVFLATELAVRSDDPQGAVLLLRSYIGTVPTDPRPHLQLGTVLLQSKDLLRASESFQTFVKMAPSDPRGPFMLGIAARSDGKTGEARRHFEDALALGPSYPDPLVQLTDMSFRDKQPAAAIERAKKQAAQAPKSAEIAFVLASAYLANGQTPQAETEYLHVIEINPDYMAAYGQLAGLYGRAKDFPRATAMVDKALAKNPDSPGMLMLSAVLSQTQGDQPKARELYEKILAKQPKFAAAANNLAYVLADEGKDLKRAQALAQTAREVAPADPDVADTMGWVFYKQGAYPGAIALFQESLVKRPNHPEVLLHLGLAQDKRGDREEAKTSVRKALELNPNLPGADLAKAILERK